MQIERLAKDPEYARKMFKRRGAFFQIMSEGAFTPTEVMELAPAIAADAVYITGKHLPPSPGVAAILQELEKHTVDCAVPQVAFMLGFMLGKAHERWRVKDPEAKHRLRAARRRGARE